MVGLLLALDLVYDRLETPQAAQLYFHEMPAVLSKHFDKFNTLVYL